MLLLLFRPSHTQPLCGGRTGEMQKPDRANGAARLVSKQSSEGARFGPSDCSFHGRCRLVSAGANAGWAGQEHPEVPRLRDFPKGGGEGCRSRAAAQSSDADGIAAGVAARLNQEPATRLDLEDEA